MGLGLNGFARPAPGPRSCGVQPYTRTSGRFVHADTDVGFRFLIARRHPPRLATATGRTTSSWTVKAVRRASGRIDAVRNPSSPLSPMDVGALRERCASHHDAGELLVDRCPRFPPSLPPSGFGTLRSVVFGSFSRNARKRLAVSDTDNISVCNSKRPCARASWPELRIWPRSKPHSVGR